MSWLAFKPLHGQSGKCPEGTQQALSIDFYGGVGKSANISQEPVVAKFEFQSTKKLLCGLRLLGLEGIMTRGQTLPTIKSVNHLTHYTLSVLHALKNRS